VRVILAVTVHTVLRRALEHAVDMALSASHTDVRAGQLESGTIVIERGWLPPCRCVALRAIRAELAVVRIILAVTIHTVLRRALEHAADVTPSASHIDVGAGQLESGSVVIERGWLPADWRMALRALCAELAVVRIILAMTVYARLWSTLEEFIGMASGAGRVRVLTNELEDRLVMVEGRRLPPCRRVALNTLRTERTLMSIVLAVTVHTCLRGALEELVSMASGAGRVRMLTNELEDRLVVVEGGRLPACCRVAPDTLHAERTLMGIILAVTVHTCLRGALEDFVSMAPYTCHVCVLAGELEDRLVVIEGGLFPVLSCVTFGAVCAECAFVGIVLAVAVRTCLRRTLEDIVDMALGAFHVYVLAGQLEDGEIVIECYLLPVIRCMALGAVCAERALVRIVLPVAVNALLRCAFEDVVDVALGTFYIHMLTGQLENRLVVIERNLSPVVRRVTFGAVSAKLTVVSIILAVAIHALL